MKKFIVVIVAIMVMAVTLTGCKTSHYYTSEARDAKWEYVLKKGVARVI